MSLPTKVQYLKDSAAFERRVRWYDYIKHKPSTTMPKNSAYIHGFHLPSSREAPKAFPETESSLLELKSELLSGIGNASSMKPKHDLSSTEKQAVISLNSCTDIVITNADKNLGTAVLNNSDLSC